MQKAVFSAEKNSMEQKHLLEGKTKKHMHVTVRADSQDNSVQCQVFSLILTLQSL